ncbi:MAG: carbon-nitrogen hydrolase family protein [Devosia sp.]
MTVIRIAAAQTPEYRDNVEAALVYAVDVAMRAEAAGARLLCFPEGFLQGYLTDESSARRVALELSSPELEAMARRFPETGPVIVIGMIEIENDQLFNTALVVERGVVIGRYRKTHLLPGEQAFRPGDDSPIFSVDGLRFGINICFDTNFPEAARKVADLGASLIVCCANNMMPRDRAEAFKDLHNAVRAKRCRETGLWLISADVTGERDGRVAWGPTAILDPQGQVLAQLPLDQSGLLVFDLPVPPSR